MDRDQQRIVCAANRMPDGTIFIGVRHWDEFMHRQADEYISAAGIEDHEVGVAEQGFIDQWGTFYDRAEAWQIAKRAGQILRTGPGYDGPELYSENLY